MTNILCECCFFYLPIETAKLLRHALAHTHKHPPACTLARSHIHIHTHAHCTLADDKYYKENATWTHGSRTHTPYIRIHTARHDTTRQTIYESTRNIVPNLSLFVSLTLSQICLT